MLVIARKIDVLDLNGFDGKRSADHLAQCNREFRIQLGAILALTGTYSDLLDYVIFAALLFYVLTVGGG